jgi:hypothetical protein
VFSSPAHTFLENAEFLYPSTLFPPGCVAFVSYLGDFHSHGLGEVHAHGVDTEQVYSGTIPLPVASISDAQPEVLDVNVEIFRVGCTELYRSIIVVFLTVPQIEDGIQSLVRVPPVFGKRGASAWSLSLAREPHSYQMHSEYLLEGDKVGFFLVKAKPYNANNMSPGNYNGEFRLHFGDSILAPSVLIPAYENQLQASALPLTGRLSGLWIVPGVPDQGFLVSISEIVGANLGPLVIFLSWNTFDADGNQLWLTGSTSFYKERKEVTVELVLVENGEFLGTKNANRTVAGSIHLHANSCSEIHAQYDLESIGLGTGELKLTRPLQMETAAFTCQDRQNRHLD